MTTQPEALRLADELIEYIDGPAFHAPHWLVRQSAAELRRLHALNQELLEALKQTESALARCFGPHKEQEGDRHRALDKVRAAIAKAEGEKQ